jgi:hypothetical protein
MVLTIVVAPPWPEPHLFFRVPGRRHPMINILDANRASLIAEPDFLRGHFKVHFPKAPRDLFFFEN